MQGLVLRLLDQMKGSDAVDDEADVATDVSASGLSIIQAMDNLTPADERPKTMEELKEALEGGRGRAKKAGVESSQAQSAKRGKEGDGDAKETPKLKDMDDHRLQKRQELINVGKNTLAYQRYRSMVPKHRRAKHHPRTPDIHRKCSKRMFDGRVSQWRRQLHEFDYAKTAHETSWTNRFFVPLDTPEDGVFLFRKARRGASNSAKEQGKEEEEEEKT